MSFPGFTLKKLRSADAPPGAKDLLAYLDLLIDGPFVASQAIHSPNSPVSSRNQRLHLFNPAFKDRITWASDQLEVHIFKDGGRIVTGYQGQLLTD